MIILGHYYCLSYGSPWLEGRVVVCEATGHISCLFRSLENWIPVLFHPAPICPFYSVKGMIQCPFKVGFPFSVKSLWKYPHRHIQKFNFSQVDERGNNETHLEKYIPRDLACIDGWHSMIRNLCKIIYMKHSENLDF